MYAPFAARKEKAKDTITSRVKAGQKDRQEGRC